ncbi:pilus assembly protein TadG-related protein [Nocardioides acrostichi]|uniref:Putative Flp pilus-assembly TadG-like N-terminal domain-containing protein n=1 Tax=Nocardioides acrostichi TaxID=2784339 RepID=A0A930V0T2_9ACTN|nr:pilus assembly protein TadG-related protein [Nocardioides acrostichi]MBF4161776.1 hypothetical protein [Nocardioides acrostichi]
MRHLRPLAQRARRRRGERGTATAFIVGLAVTMLACAGLVVDGGGALNARSRLADDAEQAARAGAQQLDIAELRNDGAAGRVELDPTVARDRAAAYLVGRGYRVADIDVTGNTVTVRTHDTVDTKLLSLIGIDHFDVEASATAEAVTQ